MQDLRWARIAPVTASVVGAFLLTGSASGIGVPDVGVPGVPPLVPPVETPQVPPVQAPVPVPPVAVPDVPDLVPSPQVTAGPSGLTPADGPSAGGGSGSGTGGGSGSGGGSAGSSQIATGQSMSPAHRAAAAGLLVAPGSPSQLEGLSSAAIASAAIPRDLSPAERKRFIARRQAAYERQLRGEVKDLLGCVYAASDFEAAVLVLRAGVSGKPLSRGGVAKRLSTSRTRVRRAESRGLRQMKTADRRTGCGEGGGVHGVDRAVGGVIAAVGTGALATASPLKPEGQPKPEPAASPRQDRDEAPDAGAVAGVTRSSSAAPGGDESEGIPFLLMLLGLALLAAVPAGAVRAAPARRPKPVEVQCEFCRSKNVAVNPVQAIYRCAGCGFSGVLPPQVAAELGNMHGSEHGRHQIARRGTD